MFANRASGFGVSTVRPVANYSHLVVRSSPFLGIVALAQVLLRISMDSVLPRKSGKRFYTKRSRLGQVRFSVKRRSRASHPAYGQTPYAGQTPCVGLRRPRVFKPFSLCALPPLRETLSCARGFQVLRWKTLTSPPARSSKHSNRGQRQRCARRPRPGR